MRTRYSKMSVKNISRQQYRSAAAASTRESVITSGLGTSSAAQTTRNLLANAGNESKADKDE